MKYKATVKVIYEFEFETDKEKLSEIKEIAEKKWNTMTTLGIEDEKFHDTEINISEI